VRKLCCRYGGKNEKVNNSSPSRSLEKERREGEDFFNARWGGKENRKKRKGAPDLDVGSKEGKKETKGTL